MYAPLDLDFLDFLFHLDKSVVYTAPQARLNYHPNQPQKFWYVPEVYKMTKFMEDGRKNG